ncbi:helix-turn-helix transcriptional regulator [Desulfosarcina sp. OttesenSCG-928-A07]|nr:helix-turn-helix transcriptional regulator [Desulfosarcina sp. OttesenSCG-928-G17]MDL2329594.1 helix-turn-helix transcriptional regulator [Desulfosarcina sp. OttesenSCG-928-A07]
MAERRYPQLEALAQFLPSFLSRYDNLFGYLHAYTLESIAIYHQHGAKAALPALEKAMELGKSDGILFTLAEYGQHILPLVEHINKNNPGEPYTRNLLRMTRNYVQVNTSAKSGMPDPTQTLTRREKQILHLVAKSKSNAHIAKHLDISPHTVAKMLSNAYRKLGAKNRIDAIRKMSQA